MSSQQMIIIGIDPGTVITGYGIIAVDRSGSRLLDFGSIKPPKTAPISERYVCLFEGVRSLVESFKPTALAIETQFVGKNSASAIKLGMARGAAVIAAGLSKIPVFEYAPKEAKKAVVGFGGASKFQVQSMIQQILGLSALPEPEDAADALAIALCHIHRIRL
jgi:crossover junction endodeoxyribonuclease RuvC